MPEGPEDQLAMPGIDPLHGKRFVVRKRDGRLDPFNEARIFLAIESAFKAVAGIGGDDALPPVAQAAVKQCADAVVARILSRAVRGEELEVEKIQDAVEERLMLAGHVEVARAYILYRERRRQARAARERRPDPPVRAVVDERIQLFRQLQRSASATFAAFVNEGEFLRLLAPEMLDYDLEELAARLRPDRDDLLSLGGLRNLCDHYLLRDNGRILESPQYFWMRVAMGLAVNEGGQTQSRAVEFYEALSTLHFIPSERILRAAGTPQPQLALCPGIVAGAGLEQTAVDSHVHAWIEPWRGDVFDFLRASNPEQQLTKGLSLPDLFLRRVGQRGRWTLFDPASVSDLHGLTGAAFADRYAYYERAMPPARAVGAAELWSAIVASGLPIRFKCADAASPRRAPLVAGAINLPLLLKGGGALDMGLFRSTVGTALRMLDNAFDISSYPSSFPRQPALGRRAVALAVLDPQDADDHAEALAWAATLASTELAAERGSISNDRAIPDNVSTSLDWQLVRAAVERHGLRHSSLTGDFSDAAAAIAGFDRSAAAALAPETLIERAARRQKWVDLPQPLALPPDPSGQWRLRAWKNGLRIVSVMPERRRVEGVDEEPPVPEMVRASA